MTRRELELLKRKLPIGPGFEKLNAPTAGADREAPTPEPQRSPETPLERAAEVKAGYPRKCLISIESRRVQLQDPDNGMEKWHIDSLRYAGLISDDSTDEVEIRKYQTKVPHFADECTVITMTELPEISATEAAQLYANYHRETHGNT